MGENMLRISLKAARANANYTIREWASILKVNPATVCNWETGKTRPDGDILRQISDLSGIPMDYIFLPSSPKKCD